MLSQIAGAIKDATHSFNAAYLLASGMLLVAGVLAILLKSPQEAKAKAAALELEPIPVIIEEN